MVRIEFLNDKDELLPLLDVQGNEMSFYTEEDAAADLDGGDALELLAERYGHQYIKEIRLVFDDEYLEVAGDSDEPEDEEEEKEYYDEDEDD